MYKTGLKLKAYAGTYTYGESKGIYSFILDTASGKLENIKLEAELGHPTYIAISSNHKYLYSVGKIGNQGGVAAFNITDHKLIQINNQLAEGSSPCHVSLSKDDNFLFAANYHKGEAASYPINSDGSIDSTASLVAHEGSGPNKERQEKPHAHYSALTPDDKYLCVIDLGIDKLVVYKVKGGILSRHGEVPFKPGCGPRHMSFHPEGKFAFLLTELSAEIVTLKYNESSGSFDILQYTPTLPVDFTGENTGSAIHVSLDGNFVYASNRGHDSIAVFKFNSETGELSFVQQISTEGNGPRDFALTPDGDFLVAANQNSNNLVPFSVDKSTGKLSRVGEIIDLPNPVCIKFISL